MTTYGAHAATWSVGATDGAHLAVASREPIIRVWGLPPTGPGVDLSPSGTSRPRVSDLCVRDGQVAIATDWGATVEVRGVDGRVGPVLRPAARRVSAVACLDGGGWAVIGLPARADPDPEAAGTGPGVVFVYDRAGAQIDRWEVPGGAVAIVSGAVGGLAALGASGQVWEGKVGAGLPQLISGARELLPGGGGRALARSSGGGLVAASAERVCVAGGACFAADGGAGRLAASAGAIAVGGFEATVVYGLDGRVLFTLPGRPAMLRFDDNGDLAVITGSALVHVDGRTWRESGRVMPGG